MADSHHSIPKPLSRARARGGPVDENRLTGLIEHIVFHSEETGFTVMKVQVQGHREPVSVVGKAPDIHAGEWLDAHGEWLVDSRHGRQFKAEEMRTTAPDTREGIEKYLASGLIRGIGPVYAAKLVERFGKEIFDVIDKRSAELETVEGIGPMRRRQIKEAWNEQQAVREIMTFLFSHGVSTARAHRIYRTYGDDAINVVQRDPYCLARDIHGIGFKSADAIAMTMGIATDSPLRARAGAIYVLQELTNNGHCAFPEEQLCEQAVELLSIATPTITQAIESEVGDGRLVREQEAGEAPLIYLATLHRAEVSLSRRLVALARGRHPCPAVDVDKAIPWVEEKVRLTLAPAQRRAVARAIEAKVLVITGGPGVGKTTIIQSILKIVTAKKLRPALCAPTGRAARRLAETSGLPAKTIHRLLAYDPRRGRFKHDHRNPLEGDIFVVDETSMIDLPLAASLFDAIPLHAAVILVGDVDQLPSVGPGSVLRDVIGSGVVPVERLIEVFRQAAASAIVTNAHRVNAGNIPSFARDKETPSDCYFIEEPDPAAAGGRITRLVRDHLPRKFGFHPLRDIQVLTPMQRGELGARNLNLLLQSALNQSPMSIERFGIVFREGDKVMQTQNDYDKDVFNGDIGQIVGMDPEEGSLKVRFDGTDVHYDFKELDELVPSYAITIHKSQGSEYPCVVIPLHTQHYVMLRRNLLYTAITRGKSMVVLVGTHRALALAVNQADTHERVTRLRERLQVAAQAP